MFDVLLSPFVDIKTEHLRFKAFEEVGVLVKPDMVDVGQRLNDRLVLGRVIFEPKSIEMSDIPLKHVLKLILENSNLFITIVNYMKDLENKSDNCISSFTQSPIWLSKLKKNPNKIVLPIFYFLMTLKLQILLVVILEVKNLGLYIFHCLVCLLNYLPQ